jgi:hypothetical protein
MKYPRLFQSAAVIVLACSLSLTACGPAPNSSGNQSANTGTTAPSITAQPGQGIIRGNLTAEGLRVSNFRTQQATADLSGASVKVSSSLETKVVETDATGKFEVAVKAGAEYTLEASVPDGRGGTLKTFKNKVNVPLAQDPPIVDVQSLVARRSGSIQGLIALEGGRSGDTPEGADIFIAGTSFVGKAGEKGRFALTEIAEGTWDVVISKAGYERQVIKGLRVQAGKPRVIAEKITLTRSDNRAGIKGKVMDGNNAVAGATVSVYAKDRDLISASAAGLDNFMAVSDEQGNFEVLNLPPGEYQVQVYRPFYQLPGRRDVTVTSNTQDLGAINLVSTTVYFGKIKGQVLDEYGNPIDSAVIQSNPAVADQQFADAKGDFTLDRVMPGEYNVSVSAGGFCTIVMPVRVENRQGFELALENPIVLPANSPLTRTSNDEGECVYVVYPKGECEDANTDITAEAGEDPEQPAPASVTSGTLSPAGSFHRDERKCRKVVNLGGMIDPDTKAPVTLEKANITLVEDGKVKAFKFTEAAASGRALPVDIGLIIDTTGSMEPQINGVKASALKFVESLYDRNIDVQIGAVAYADGITTNPAAIQPANDPAAMTIPGFEFLTPFVDDEGLSKPDALERKLRANSVTEFLSGLNSCYGGECGAAGPEGLLDSLHWTAFNGAGTSVSSKNQTQFGWRERAQKVFIILTDAPTWETGGAEISPDSPWTVSALAQKLREANAVVHVVSPDFSSYGFGNQTGDPKGLAVANSPLSGTPSAGTGGTWTQMPSNGDVDLNALPVVQALGNSVKLEFISYNTATSEADEKEHEVRVIIDYGGKKGETTFKASY